MTVKGRIHSMESFGTLDGPGIRFIVFMQGCPLRCIYCHNRDTWDLRNGKEITVEEIIEEVKGYLPFLKSSGGGITISGGEPTLQAEFVTEVFKKCRELNIHTALDTNGHAEISKVRELLSYTDLVLLDLKQADEKKHLEITGVNRKKIKEFALYTAQKKIPLWIRYILIPGYTDEEQDLKKAAHFICSLTNVQKIEVLPYHNLGEYKWESLKQEYKLKGVLSPTAQDVQRAINILRDCSEATYERKEGFSNSLYPKNMK
ncbi:MAG: pyruvate formate-lyase-activating protein [Desulfitobacteriia bacterium]